MLSAVSQSFYPVLKNKLKSELFLYKHTLYKR